MIYELRLFDFGKDKPFIMSFTDEVCRGKPVQYAESLMAGFDRFQLLEKHFDGPESTKDYGYGVGYEPIMVGSV